MVLPPKRFYSPDCSLAKREYRLYYGGYYPEMGQMLRGHEANGLKTQFMGPEGVGTYFAPIAGGAAEGMLVTMPKRYDPGPGE